MKTIFTLSLLTIGIAFGFTGCSQKSEKESESAQAYSSSSSARKSYYEVAPNVKLHVTDLGDGPVVVLIPGYPLGDESWEYQYPALVKAGYRVVGITMRGFGNSDKPYGKYTYDQFADDIKSVLDQMNIKDAVLGGHSMGGAISLHYTAKYNGAHLKKLALFAAAAPRHTKTADYPYPLFNKETITGWVNQISIDRPALLAGIGSQFALTPTAINPGIGNWLYNQELQSSPYAMEQALISLRDEDLRADLPKIKIPTLIMQAKEDHIVAYALAQQMNKAITGSQLVTFDKSGHALFIEEREKFNNELLRFIKE
ncbi:alpha/beta hydrolase [Mucilaginibacter sp. UR6-1]|uniref:alpha/beta fold hydrolase n=1 Tax=Mucilaginibacter sp. UR6-1 TaxID=1435643 RepID=UPI001E62C800|nr:alpha/beta hydrolase [Mucilaginibacter sp. UR6-1]MCC8408215.1 alpha/beta hydrolase [Mucilaginibacter sp. UR6-1]